MPKSVAIIVVRLACTLAMHQLLSNQTPSAAENGKV